MRPEPLGASPASVLSLGRIGGTPELSDAGKAFESYLVGQILRDGSQPIVRGGFRLDGGPAGRMFRDLFHQEIARVVAERGSFGIAKLVESAARRADEPERGGGGPR